jgi:hypothetical protein
MNFHFEQRSRWALAITVVFGFTAANSTSADDGDRLRLTAEMVINETGLGDAVRIVDEQEAVGDPRGKSGKRPESAYLTGWQKWMFPAQLIIDAGAEQKVEQLFLFNESGAHKLLFESGAPKAWSKPQEIAFDRYQEWHEVRFAEPTRYVRITFEAPTSIPEVVAYGRREPSRVQPAASQPVERTRPTFDTFIGTNAFIDDPIELIAPIAGTMREYHGIGWDFEHPDHERRFQPSGAAGGNLWFFDDFYRKLHEAGVEVFPCVQQSLPWQTGHTDPDARAIAKGGDPADPASYRDHAAHMFQFAARYGSRVIPDDQLVLGEGQPRESGLGLLRYFENANEPDKDWKERVCMSSPFEFAAQCSADYDGHLGSLGPGHGVHMADPEAMMVLGGLYRQPLMYLRAMKFWADHYRDGSFPADVINVHHYCGDGDAQQAFRKQGISPEQGDLRNKMAAIVAWRDQSHPAAEIWLTEFGYDTHPGSPLHAPQLGSLDAETVQAAWLARAYFLLSAAGIDRTMMFMFRDVDEQSTQVFSTSGLVTAKGRWKPKPSWYFQAALKTHLAGMTWDADVPTGRKNVIAMRFRGEGKSAIAVWCWTNEDRREQGVRMPVRGARAQLVNLTNGEAAGRISALAMNNGEVTIDASEVPVLIISE